MRDVPQFIILKYADECNVADGEAALLRHSLAAMTSRCDALCHEVSEGQAVVRSLQGKLLAAHELTSRMRSLVHARWGEGGASEEGEGEEEEAHTSGPYLTAGARKGVDTVTSAMLQHMEDQVCVFKRSTVLAFCGLSLPRHMEHSQAREIEALMAAGLEDAPTAIELQAATDTIRKQKALIQSLQATVTSLIASASQPDSECVWELTQKEKALREREEHVYSLQQAVEAKADLLATQEREMKVL